jgi:transposase-like protein
LTDTGNQEKEKKDPISEKKQQRLYSEEFKRHAVEMVIHSGKTLAQVARELGCSDMSLGTWKRAYLKQMAPAQIEGRQQSAEEMVATIRAQQKEIEYLKRQREILKKAMSILGEEPNPGMR